jgi:ATP-dependent Clp protease adaptor protein ClpS
MSTPKNGNPNEKTDVLTRTKLKKPPLYRVVFHNDDYTTREFVVSVLQRYFYKSLEESMRLMLLIHHTGKGIGGVFPYDIALSKMHQVETLAAKFEMPLRLSLEPDE